MLFHAIYRTCNATMHILNILPRFHTVYVDILYLRIKTQALESNSCFKSKYDMICVQLYMTELR